MWLVLVVLEFRFGSADATRGFTTWGVALFPTCIVDYCVFLGVALCIGGWKVDLLGGLGNGVKV